MFEGMLDIANTQNQLAVVLGHEMAHALLEHGVSRASMLAHDYDNCRITSDIVV